MGHQDQPSGPFSTDNNNETGQSQSIEPKRPPEKPSWWSRADLDTWTWEICAGILCICLLAAIVGLLVAYNHRSTPDLPGGLTINAIISLLAGFAKAALMVVVTAAIRQEKWLWFISKPRPLDTVDDFEDASRGPYGSLLLILSLRGSLRALLAAFVTILTLGFEPFLQQVIAIDVRDVPITSGPQASILAPTSYDEPTVGNLVGSGLSLNAMIGAFGGASGATPTPICPSGNCTWPTYHTLALCTACEDMTDRVNLTGDAFTDINLTSYFADFAQSNASSRYITWKPTYSFPTGNQLNVTVTLELVLGSSVQWSLYYPRQTVWPLNIDPSPNSLWAFGWSNNTQYGGIRDPLFAMGYMSWNFSSDFSSIIIDRATQCALTPCVRTMGNTRVHNGALSANVTHTDYGDVLINHHNADGSISAGWTATVQGTDYFVLDAGMGNVLGHAALLIRALRNAMEGNTTYIYGGYWYADPAEADSISNQSTTAFSQTGGPWSSAGQQAIDGSGNFSDVVDGIGRAVTGRFQQLQDTVVLGTALRTETVVVVRWAWIAYPLALVALGLAAMLSTAVSTRRHHMAVWKESTLPLLFRYRGSGSGGKSGHGAIKPTDPNRSEHEHEYEHESGTGFAIPPLSWSSTFSSSSPNDTDRNNKVSWMIAQANAEQAQLQFQHLHEREHGHEPKHEHEYEHVHEHGLWVLEPCPPASQMTQATNESESDVRIVSSSLSSTAAPTPTPREKKKSERPKIKADTRNRAKSNPW